MRMNKKQRFFLGIFLIYSIISVSCQKNKEEQLFIPSDETEIINKKEQLFIPLGETEVIKYERKSAEILWDIQFYAEDTVSKERRDLYLVPKYTGEAYEVNDQTKIFFSARNEIDGSVIWCIDGKKGTINQVVEAPPNYASTSNGQYLCFLETHESFKTSDREIRTVYVYDVANESIIQEYNYNHQNASFMNQRISYNAEENCFVVEMAYDDDPVEQVKLYIPNE